MSLILHLSKLVIWGSLLGSGAPISLVMRVFIRTYLVYHRYDNCILQLFDYFMY